MTQAYTFDDLDNEASQKSSGPIWAMRLSDPSNEQAILRWLKQEQAFLEDENEPRIRLIQRNLALYKGIQYRDQQNRDDIRDRNEDRNRVIPKIVANILYDLVENRISRLLKYKPAVVFLPTNDEFHDKISAKSTEALLSHIWYSHNFEGETTPLIAKLASIAGEACLLITWNPYLGDLHPDYVKLKGKDGKPSQVTLKDESGAPLRDDAGNVIKLSSPVRIGDVDYEVLLPTQIFFQQKPRWKDVEYCFIKRCMPVEEARVRWKDKADQIKANDSAQIYDFEKMEIRTLRNEVIVWEFYHKATDILDEGRYIVYTEHAVLANKKLPYSHGELPIARFTDIDVPGELYGRSFFENVKQLTSTYNNLTNIILRNQLLVSHPKWAYPAGSVKKEQLGNDITMLEFKGPVPPQLIQANPTPAEVFGFRKDLKEEIKQLAGVFGVSTGEPPPGIKSGVALQFVSEQEQERHNISVLKWNEFIRQVARKSVATAADYYDASDERMIRVLGKNAKWMSIFFDQAHLNKDYDVRVQNSSALPQSKAARTQYLMDLYKEFPNQVDPDQVLDMLDLSQSDKFLNVTTINVRNAEAENEMMMSQDFVGADNRQLPPKVFEDHIVHWKIHLRQMQEFSFKYQTPKEVQEFFEDHLRAHEMFMVQMGASNKLYAEKLAQLYGFPLYFVIENPQMEQVEQIDSVLSTNEAPQAGPAPNQTGVPARPGAATDGGPLSQGPMQGSIGNMSNELAVNPPPETPIELTGAV